MNKKLLLPLIVGFLLMGSTSIAQNTYEIKCTMTVEQVLRAQTWDIDDAPSEFAMNYTELLFNDINAIYTKVNNGQSTELQEHFDSIDDTIKKAKTLGMNYSMFQDDLDIIETFK